MSEEIKTSEHPPGPPVLRADELCYTRQNRQLITKASLTLSAGQITLLAGHNGAGKSLLLQLLHGLMPPDSGQLSGPPGKQQKMVFQKPVLLRRSTRQHLAFLAPQLDRDGLDACLARAGLLDRQQVPTRQLSGGEAQKLALTGALATRPKLLFLDEPTASLDYESTRFVEDSLQQARAGGMAILMVSHNRTQIKRLADRVLFLARGTITDNAQADAFFAQPESRVAQDWLDFA